MKKNYLKKVFSLIVAVAMLMSLFVGCGENNNINNNSNNSQNDANNSNNSNNRNNSNNSNDSNNDNTQNQTSNNNDQDNQEQKTGPVKLSVYTTMHDTLGAEAENIWFWEYAKETMNLEFDITQIQNSALSERKNLMFASNELPDILMNLSLSTNELVKYGQTEKQLLDMDPYLSEETSPNLLDCFEKYPVSYAISKCPDGGLYNLPYYTQENDEGAVPRIFINDTWLEQCDLQKPETLDEFFNVLKTFKEEDPAGDGKTVPIGGGYEAFGFEFYILTALGVVSNGGLLSPSIKDGEAIIPANDPVVYEEFVRYMKKLYDEELMNKDYYTIDQTQTNGQVAEKRVGVYRQVPYVNLPEKEDYLQWSALSPLTSELNDEKVWLAPDPYHLGTLAISSQCETPEVALNFLDFFYSEKGAVYAWIGPVKDSEDTLGLIDGWYYNEEDKLIFEAVEKGTFGSGYEYVLGAVAPASGALGNRSNILDSRRKAAGLEPIERVFDLDSGDQAYRKSVVENVMPYTVPGYPKVYLTEEESIRLSDLNAVLSDYVEAETAKFILGDNDIENIDKFFRDLEKLGIDEYTTYYVEAYHTYLDNLN